MSRYDTFFDIGILRVVAFSEIPNAQQPRMLIWIALSPSIMFNSEMAMISSTE